MNEQHDFEHLVADRLSHAGVGMPPESAIEDTIARAGGTRRLPEWLALIKEPPMRTNNHLAVGSPTVRVAAVMLATLLLALALAAAGAGAQRLLAADGPIVVAQDGSGRYETITEAVAAAEDGDEILVRPGTYVEAVLIDKDLTIEGDGPIEGIVVSAPGDGPVAPAGDWGTIAPPDNPYAILVVGSDARVAGLTLRGERSALQAQGGAPSFHALRFERVGRPFDGVSRADASVVLSQGTTAELSASEFVEGGVVRIFDASDVLIADNHMADGPYVQGNFGNGAVVRDNTILRSARNCVTMSDPTTALFEGNTCHVSDAEEAFFFLGGGAEYEPVIRGNVIEGALVGVDVPSGGQPRIEDNEFIGNLLAIDLPASDAIVVGNVIRDGVDGIVASVRRAPDIRDNLIVDNSGRGIWVGNGSTAMLVGNELCGNSEDIVVEDGAEPVMDGNTICEDAPTE